MSYKIEKDLLVDDGKDTSGKRVEHHDTRKKSGKLKQIKYLVIHYTASDSFKGDIATLSTSKREASCHLVLSPEGQFAQIGNFKDCLWHAGKSAYKGLSGLNRYSIGIEVTCPGPVKLIRSPELAYKFWNGKVVKATESPYNFVEASHKNGGGIGWWAGFTDAQNEALIEVGSLIMKHYKIEEAVGHDMIAPGRKIDPGPCLPDRVYAALNGRKEDHYEEEEDLKPLEERIIMTVSNVAPDYLNFRNAPGGDKIGSLREGTPVELLEKRGTWFKVKTPAGYIGFVSGYYLK